jgi:hypothetical protein
VLALKCLSVYQLTIWTLNYLNSAVLTTLQVKGLNDSSFSAKTYRLGVAAISVSVANPPIGHLHFSQNRVILLVKERKY